MNIVITGGAGFIGINLAKYYSEKGDRVVCIDNLSTSTHRPWLERNEEFHIADLSNKDEVDMIDWVFDDADIVYHLASSVGVKYIDSDPKGTLLNSFYINNNLFPIFEKNSNRVVFASTSEVYGNKLLACETDTLQIGSTDVMRWGYACGKLMSEFLLKAHTFPSSIARFFNVTGKYQTDEHGMVLPTFINNAINNKDIVVHGDGSQTRSFCDIRDAIKMLDVISKDEHIGQTYNIGNSNNYVSIQQLAEIVVRQTNSNSNIVYKPYSDCFSEQSKDINARSANTNKINKFYKPEFSIEQIVQSML